MKALSYLHYCSQAFYVTAKWHPASWLATLIDLHRCFCILADSKAQEASAFLLEMLSAICALVFAFAGGLTFMQVRATSAETLP
jgi:hypothetical protein